MNGDVIKKCTKFKLASDKVQGTLIRRAKLTHGDGNEGPGKERQT